MPTYAYKCSTCNIIKDEIKSINDDSAPVCDCGLTMKQTFTECNFVLKGGGWGGADLREKNERSKRGEKMQAKTNERKHCRDFG